MRALWSWLLCLAAVVALRPEHEIHVHGTEMEADDAGHKIQKTADPPTPRCMVKDRSKASRFRKPVLVDDLGLRVNIGTD